jgi:lipopolysaccharide biosynthesis regulator YciM
MPEYLGLGLLFLLLPVAAASGWIMARRERRAGHQDARGPELAGDYFRGLNFLLNEQPDKAIEVFINLLDVDGDTVETHLALGNLFRRRGEVDRAIRIHQNLIAKTSLSHEQRSHAMLELGMDYMRSGLLDRAETLFRELLEMRSDAEPALLQLVHIYQQEQDWDKAIDTSRQLETVSGRGSGAMIAHFLCEKAEAARGQGEISRALALVREAMTVDHGCARASLIEGAIAAADGRLDEAIAAYARIEDQDPDFLPEAVPHLVNCYRRQGRLGDLRNYLEALAKRRRGLSPVLALAELAADAGAVDRALGYVGSELDRRPNARGLDRYLQYAVARAQGDRREELVRVRDYASRLAANDAAYRCADCGFSGRVLHWQCPSCKSWNTVKPLHGASVH